MRKMVLALSWTVFLLMIASVQAHYAGEISPQVKTYSSYDLIHHGQLLFPDAWHPKPLKLYYAEKFIPAISNRYEIRLPYVMPSSFKYSCDMFKHDGYYYVTTDLSCYGYE
ncbi:MAG TPA: hypothetical protein VJG90_01210 [Candidatus Nanoarchaeia archaeon]|nr:hypothetical protein [Candidatus Nanoarchaeia archaeon]